MVSPLDIRIKKNNDYRLIFTVKRRDGSIVDITDFSIKYQARKTITGPALITKSTDDNSIAIINAALGTFVVLINAEDTRLLESGAYYHEAVMTDTVGKVTTLTDLAVSLPQLYLVNQIAKQN